MNHGLSKETRAHVAHFTSFDFITLQWRQLNDRSIFEINNILLHSDWGNLYEMSIDDSYTTFIKKIRKLLIKLLHLRKLL